MPTFTESNSQHSIIRWWSAHNHRFINIKRSVCCCEIIAKRQANPLWQTGRRFMYTLAHSYGVTRRGMTQCISASLLVLDRWSRPNMTVPSLILSKACANFMYRLYWQWWLIGNVKNVSVPPPPVTPGAAQQRFTTTFGCSIRCKRFMTPECHSHSQDLHISHLCFICFLLKEVVLAVITFNTAMT